MLWQVEIRPKAGEIDREGQRVLQAARELRANSIRHVQSGHGFLLEGELSQADVERAARELLVDAVTETYAVRIVGTDGAGQMDVPANRLNVLYKPGVTDNVAQSALPALKDLGLPVEAVASTRLYDVNVDASPAEVNRWAGRSLANDAIERLLTGPLKLTTLSFSTTYPFELRTVDILDMDDAALARLSKEGQLYLSLVEMQTIQAQFRELGRNPTDIELETVAQTWSEHCSHKTLAGRIHYQDDTSDRQFQNMLKETIFAATQTLRQQWGADDWCVSVFKDNAGIVKFDDEQNVCFKVETHNHPSAIEPYGGANTGIGGVIRDPLGTGLGARPVCNTDVFCFAPPDTPHESLPPGVLHPKQVAQGVVAGVRDYGNRMGIPTVNGSVYFDERYLGNPLVYCGTVAMIPVDKCDKEVSPGEYIVSIGGRTGRDGIHGATFSSAELTEESETISGGAVQIGNAITEKMVHDILLEARDKGLYSAVTDCGAGGFSSAVGEMGEETGAEVWLDKAPLKYAGLSYTEIWISEAQERMVLSVPEQHWDAFFRLCAAEGVEATRIGQFTDTGRLVLKYGDTVVGDLPMSFLHDGRPPVVREAKYVPPVEVRTPIPEAGSYDADLKAILGSLNVCSKEWIVRQYDHEVQAGSVVKPLVGIHLDGPSDAAVVRPDFKSPRGLVVSNGMNPRFGDLDPYWMALAAVDEALRNCVAVGADPSRIAILDNFCWGNTERPETLGSLVRAALGCHDAAIAYGTPFISGKDSLNNEFSYVNLDGERKTVAIPSSLLISALGQVDDVRRVVTMDLKQPGNLIYQVGATSDEMGGSHWMMIRGLAGGRVPQVQLQKAPALFAALHKAIHAGLVRSCHDLSEGGLAVAAAEMAFAGGYGLDLDLHALGEDVNQLNPTVLLFSESCSRFLVEVPPASAAQFEAALAGYPCVKLGTVVAEGTLSIHYGQKRQLVNSKLTDLKKAWQETLAWS